MLSPILHEPLTPGQRAMRRDASFPDHTDHEDALSLLTGDLSDIRRSLQGLLKHLANHQDIDRDVWIDLRDFVSGAVTELEDLLCVSCLQAGRVQIGRGWGFDAKSCDACQRMECER